MSSEAFILNYISSDSDLKKTEALFLSLSLRIRRLITSLAALTHGSIPTNVPSENIDLLLAVLCCLRCSDHLSTATNTRFIFPSLKHTFSQFYTPGMNFFSKMVLQHSSSLNILCVCFQKTLKMALIKNCKKTELSSSWGARNKP